MTEGDDERLYSEADGRIVWASATEADDGTGGLGPGDEVSISFADEQQEDELLKVTTDRYNSQTTPYYAAARLWVDGVVDPLETRTIISMGIEAANHSMVEKFNVGVIQT